MRNYKAWHFVALLITMVFFFQLILTNVTFSQSQPFPSQSFPAPPPLSIQPNCIVVYQPSCPPGYSLFLRMSNYMNAHAEVPALNNYDYVLCCNASLGGYRVDFDIKNSTGGCPPDYKCFLHLSSPTNAHAELCSQSNYNVFLCAKAESLDPGLRIVDFKFIPKPVSQDCLSNTECVLVLSNATNAHVGNCSYTSPSGWRICMNLTVQFVSPTDIRTFIPEVVVPSTLTAYEGREMRFLITVRNRGALDGVVKLKLIPQDVALYGNVYFTSKKYAREERTETEVYLGPGDTKYAVASVLPPVSGTYTIKIKWEDTYTGVGGEEQLTVNVVQLGGEEAEGMPGIEIQHILVALLAGSVIFIRLSSA